MEKADPAIEAIRDVRRALSRRFGNDPGRLVAYYLEIQERFRDRVQHGPGEPEDEGQQGSPGTCRLAEETIAGSRTEEPG